MATFIQSGLEPSARHLLTEEQFRRVAELVVRDNEGLDESFAERIVNEALKFVAAAVQNNIPGRGLRPSATVDMGWHALILHTELYAELCGRLGHFIHHRPEGPSTLRRVEATVSNTLDAIREAGYEPDAHLWNAIADTEMRGAECMHSECTGGGSGCAPPEPNPPTSA